MTLYSTQSSHNQIKADVMGASSTDTLDVEHDNICASGSEYSALDSARRTSNPAATRDQNEEAARRLSTSCRIEKTTTTNRSPEACQIHHHVNCIVRGGPLGSSPHKQWSISKIMPEDLLHRIYRKLENFEICAARGHVQTIIANLQHCACSVRPSASCTRNPLTA